MIASTWGLIGAAVWLGFGLLANLVILPMFERTAAWRAATATGAAAEQLARHARVRIPFLPESVVLPVFFYFAFSSLEA